MKSVKKAAVVGGNNLKVTDKWVNTLALLLDQHKVKEVVITDVGAGSKIGEMAAGKLGIPNVILSGQKMVDRADMVFTLPGGRDTRSYTKMFVDAKKKVVTVEGGE